MVCLLAVCIAFTVTGINPSRTETSQNIGRKTSITTVREDTQNSILIINRIEQIEFLFRQYNQLTISIKLRSINQKIDNGKSLIETIRQRSNNDLFTQTLPCNIQQYFTAVKC